ncbi:MAG: ribonuclease P protein component [Clostridia bacterium]|nr:ribonuclease P protein component [Clostridia bacterium]
MSKLVTLNKNNQFKRLYGKGRQFASPLLVTYCIKKKSGIIRYGITASKKIGCAVERNRARRVIREAYRAVYPEIASGADIVFVARGKTTRCKTDDVTAVMRLHLRDAGILK